MSWGKSRSQCRHNVDSKEVKAAPVQTMKAYWVTGSIAPLIRNLASQCRWVNSHHALSALSLGQRAPSTHWTGGSMGPRAWMEILENKNLLFLLEFEPQVIQPLA